MAGICRKWKNGIAVLLGISLLSAHVTASEWNTEGIAINYLTMGSVKGEIEEQYEIPIAVMPGVEVEKRVDVRNAGNTDLFVRVSVEKRFGQRMQDGSFQEDANLDIEMIQIQYDTEYWVWKDGYWYYKEVLEPGSKTKRALFESYTLSEKAGNEYKKKDAEIIVNMETVHAGEDTLSIWNTTQKEIGINYNHRETREKATVILKGRKEGFELSNQGDLFPNFKKLVPGETKNQEIVLVNESNEKTDWYLNAEEIQQEYLNPIQEKAIERLLRECGQLEIYDKDKLLYRGSVDGNLTGKGNSMKKQIFLGSIKPGSKKSLSLVLRLSTDMDNELQDMIAKVKWKFQAVGNTKSQTTPQTGDDTEIVLMIVLVCISIILFVSAFLAIKQKRQRE